MANLKVEIRESIKLNENSYDSYNKTFITGINETLIFEGHAYVYEGGKKKLFTS